MNEVAIAIVVWILCAFLGAMIGSNKEAPGTGFLLGLLLGPIGLIVALSVDGRRTCPKCGTRVIRRAEICPGCGGEVPEDTRIDPQSEVQWGERLKQRRDLPPRSPS